MESLRDNKAEARSKGVSVKGCGFAVFRLPSFVNGATQLATRPSVDCARPSSRCPTSADGSARDPVSGLGVHMVSPDSAVTTAWG